VSEKLSVKSKIPDQEGETVEESERGANAQKNAECEFRLKIHLAEHNKINPDQKPKQGAEKDGNKSEIIAEKGPDHCHHFYIAHAKALSLPQLLIAESQHKQHAPADKRAKDGTNPGSRETASWKS
jgi:hypothetical protein